MVNVDLVGIASRLAIVLKVFNSIEEKFV